MYDAVGSQYLCVGAILAAVAGFAACGDESGPTNNSTPSGSGGSAQGGAPGAGGGTTTNDASVSSGSGGDVSGGTGGNGGATGTGGAGGAAGGGETGGAGGGDAGAAGAAGGFVNNCPGGAVFSAKAAIRPQATFHDAVNKLFGSTDPFIKNTVLPNIDKYRKSDATVKIVTADGMPASGYQVTATLTNPDFKWGACPVRPMMGSESNPPAVEEKLWGEMFNLAIPQYTTKWANIEAVRGTYDYTAADTLLGIMDRNGVQMEQHFLVGYHPEWLATVTSDADKAKAQEAFALSILARYKDRVKFFQVYNEDFKTHIDRANIYVNETGFFQKISSMYPNLNLGVNDCWQFVEPGGLPTPASVKTRFPGIHFLGVHVHNPRRLWASPQQIYQTFDPYTNSGVFLHMTEFGIIKDEAGDTSLQGTAKTGNWTDALLAEYFVQTFVTAFSHPAVEAFNHFGVGPDINRYTGNNLFLDGGILTPAYHALRSLLVDKLRTLAEGASDANGEVKYRGFQGEYEVTAKSPAGTTYTGRFYLKPGGPQTFVLKVTDQSLCVAQ
jgi:hypothetical protein